MDGKITYIWWMFNYNNVGWKHFHHRKTFDTTFLTEFTGVKQRQAIGVSLRQLFSKAKSNEQCSTMISTNDTLGGQNFASLNYKRECANNNSPLTYYSYIMFLLIKKVNCSTTIFTNIDKFTLLFLAHISGKFNNYWWL